MKAPDTFTIHCPLCAKPIGVPYTVKSQRIDGKWFMTFEGDPRSLMEHAESHRGPDGDGGLPLPVAA